jgi:hypothetical protein
MPASAPTRWIAFAGNKRIAIGAPREVALAVKAFATAHPDPTPSIFDASSSQTVELDLRGTVASVLRRLPPEPPVDKAPDTDVSRGPGRPKLGVVAREVTLLPRHWNWLATQPGGASVALRKLVEHAQRANAQSDRLREARDAAYRFMHAMAGDAPGFEEASRALFAGDMASLRDHVAKWPRDVREHALALAGQAWTASQEQPAATVAQAAPTPA